MAAERETDRFYSELLRIRFVALQRDTEKLHFGYARKKIITYSMALEKIGTFSICLCFFLLILALKAGKFQGCLSRNIFNSFFNCPARKNLNPAKRF
jgi:hypothetical protein